MLWRACAWWSSSADGADSLALSRRYCAYLRVSLAEGLRLRGAGVCRWFTLFKNVQLYLLGEMVVDTPCHDSLVLALQSSWAFQSRAEGWLSDLHENAQIMKGT